MCHDRCSTYSTLVNSICEDITRNSLATVPHPKEDEVPPTHTMLLIVMVGVSEMILLPLNTQEDTISLLPGEKSTKDKNVSFESAWRETKSHKMKSNEVTKSTLKFKQSKTSPSIDPTSFAEKVRRDRSDNTIFNNLNNIY